MCGKEWGEGFEIEWANDNGSVSAINYTCDCSIGKEVK